MLERWQPEDVPAARDNTPVTARAARLPLEGNAGAVPAAV